MESVASMDSQDEQVMSESFGSSPWQVDAAGVCPCHRPRLYWCDWELMESEGAIFGTSSIGRQTVELKGNFDEAQYILPGWTKGKPGPFPTFTTSRPRSTPGYKPAGIQQCSSSEKKRWIADKHRFPPYQYRQENSLRNAKGDWRLPSIQERECMMGFPKDYTTHCLPKANQGSETHLDCRLTLIGNSWNVTVVSWLMSQVGSLLGLNPKLSVGEVIQRTAPGNSKDFQTFLTRPPLVPAKPITKSDIPMKLVSKLVSQISIKGSDILLQASSEDMVRYQRLRASVPSTLWQWKTVASWQWQGSQEHINVLEMRSVLTSLRWRIERRKALKTKFVHLVDSLVVLHSLSRGRSSSKKLRRTLLRINALLLASHSLPVWAYVHTKDNPADAPSRHRRKRKWHHAKAAS